jgi:hypothetical protein
MNEFMSDALDDLRDFAGFGCPFAPPAPMGPVVTDPEFAMLINLYDAFGKGLDMGRAKAATETKPYVAAVGSRKALKHTLYQTGVIS